MRFSASILCLLIGLPVFPLAAQEPSALEVSRQQYQEARARLDAGEAKERASILEAYAATLLRHANGAQAEGNLNAYLSLTREREAVQAAGQVPGSEPDGVIGPLRQALDQALLGMERRAQASRRSLEETYLRHVEARVIELTRANRIPDALAFRAEGQRIRENLTVTPAPAYPGPVPRHGGAFRLAWPGASGPASLSLSPPDAAQGASIFHEGENRLRARGLECRGGVSGIDGVEAALAAACRTTGELTLLLSFETDTEAQTGPARILTFSKGPFHRNFTIGQQNDRLILRLRTSDSGENGGRPEVVLANIVKNKRTKVAVTFATDTLRVFVDGREQAVPAQVTGNLSTWADDCKFRLGNEIGGERPWRGLIHAFSVANRVLPPDEALLWTR